MRVETMGLAPSAPPRLTAAKMVNTTTAFVSWEEPTTRGLVSGYQVGGNFHNCIFMGTLRIKKVSLFC